MLSKGALEPLLREYQTSFNGLTNEEASARLLTVGPNEIKPQKRASYLQQFLDEFKDLMVIILIVATILALLAGEITDALIIFLIVIVNAAIGFAQKFKAGKAIEALKKLLRPETKVLRAGQLKKIPIEEIVPGDVLILEEGDHIAADAILFEANELQAQEAILTGESLPVEKSIENPVFMGTSVTHGTGRAIVIKTGLETEMGRIAKLTAETKKDKSPLQKELFELGALIGKLTFVIALFLFLYGIFIQKRALIDTLLFATSIAVAAVPEGLPATITIALAVGVQRMAKEKAIIKQLAAVETLGAVTVICTDKTGTLTKNEMTVKECYFDRYHTTVYGIGYNPDGRIEIKQSGQLPIAIGQKNEITKLNPHLYQTLELFLITAGLCNNSTIIRDQNDWKVIGDPTEGALITLVKKSGLDFETVKDDYEKLHEFAFDSSRKCMSVLYRQKSNGRIFVFAKGAPGQILQICNHVMMNHHAILMDQRTKQDILHKNGEMAENALRVLGFAWRELSPHEQKMWEKYHASQHAGAQTGAQQENHGQHFPFTKEDIEKNLVFLGLAGMIDPARSEVKEAIETAKKAGIKIYMVTGDHGLTAKAIGQQIGLIENPKPLTLTGEQLNEMGDKELKNLLASKKLEIIFARVSPEHKLRLVSLLKEIGEIVAVTGDGVNDAPALKRADIGIAMGSGTDVSKEASNMVLADDSFSTIVKAVREGRTIYDNLKKFVFYIFSSNIGELLLIFAAIIFNMPVPLTAILILCINLFTDVLPALALGVETGEEGNMSKKPRRKEQKMLNRYFLGRIFYVGFFVGGLALAAFFFELRRRGWEFGQTLDSSSPIYMRAVTVAFTVMVMIQMANALNAKSETASIFKRGFLKNKLLLGAISVSVLITIAIVEVPLLQKYLHTTLLSVQEWILIVGGSLLIIAVEESRKWAMRKFYSRP